MSSNGVRKIAFRLFSPENVTCCARAVTGVSQACAVLLALLGNALAQGVCDRTPQVRDGLVDVSGVSTCGEVTPGHLATLKELGLSWTKIAELREHDFNGLAGLERLELNGNRLRELPEGVFRGLNSLQSLGLSNNRLRELSPGVFGELVALQRLNLTGNDLSELPEGVFGGLSGLKELRLWGNRLTDIPGPVFHELNSLQYLGLSNNRLRELPDGVFSRLDSLSVLQLAFNRLKDLPEGVFDDILDTLARPMRSGFAGFSEIIEFPDAKDIGSGLSLDSLVDHRLKATLAFKASAQKAADGDRITVVVYLTRPLPVAVRVAYSVGGSATTDDYTDLSPPPDRGLLFLAGETRKEIALTLRENTDGQDKTVVLTLGKLSKASLRRSDGSGEDAPYLKASTLIRVAEGGALHTATIFDIPPAAGLEGVCSRTPQVRDALAEAISAGSACAEVSEVHLAGVTKLDLSYSDLTTLQAGDLSGLGSLQRLELQGNYLSNLPERIFGGLASLKVLTLSGNSLSTLSEETFAELSSLERLELHGNLLSTLSEGIFSRLSSLEELDLSGNSLRVLPKGIFGGLTSLQDLSLDSNSLSNLDEEVFSDLPDLEQLQLRDNFLSTLPGDVLIGLSSLTSLDLSGNSLNAISSDGFDGMTGLEWLDLNGNFLSALPEEVFSGLENLKVLWLGDNFLPTLPGGVFSRLGNLLGLGLHDNLLSLLPVRILSGLRSLEWLNLDNNDLKALPEEVFSGLGELRSLRLDGNQLRALPEGIFSGLGSLERLTLVGNHLNTLARGVFSGLSKLEVLVLHGNNLVTLPQGVFSGLSNLERLWLGANALTSLPEGVFSGLRNLVRLDLSGNSLSTLHEGIFGGLSKLEELWLDSNSLTTLPAGIFSDLGALKVLALNDNQLGTLPAGIFSGLGNLEDLVLHSNNLITLPPGVFSGLSNLQRLWLGANPLSSLPARIFAGLDNLELLDLSDNSLSTLPAGIFDDLLDTLGVDSYSSGLDLDSDLKATLGFGATGQIVAQGMPVSVTVALSRPLPLAVRVPFSVSGTATSDDYTDLSPSPSRGLLFLAGETRKEITSTLLQTTDRRDKTVVLKLGDRSGIELLRSDGTGEKPPYLKAEALLNISYSGSSHTVTVSDSDPARFTSALLVEYELYLRGSESGYVTVDFGSGRRFEFVERTLDGTLTIQTGTYAYQHTGLYAAALTLNFDDGESCQIRLAFTSARAGAFSDDCSDRTVVEGSFSLSGDGSRSFVPVILSSAGLNNSFFTSEMTLTNQVSRQVRLDYTYTADQGGGSGRASDVLGPGQQKIVLNVIDYLRGLGIPIPEAGNRLGTLQVDHSSHGEVGVLVRTTTAVADGRAGVAYRGVFGFSKLPDFLSAYSLPDAVYLCGLRQNGEDRSNVALQNTGTPLDGPVTLRTTVFSGDPASPSVRVLGDVTLEPREFHQYSGVLGSVANGFVRVERVEGDGPFYAYGVINDQANSDGSFVFPDFLFEKDSRSRQRVTEQILPVILETGGFSSELVVTNISDMAKTVQFSFVADAVQAPDHTAEFTMMLEAGEQRIVPHVVNEMRRQDVAGIGPAGRTFAGPVFATADGGDMNGIVIAARTGSPGGGGQYSVFYGARGSFSPVVDYVSIDGLQQNEENRSNLALVNTGFDGDASVFQLDIHDGETGMLVNTVTGVTVPHRSWHQINSILADYAPGTTQGYVHIRQTTGENPFLAYGVINDGGTPGQGSGDGAYLPPRSRAQFGVIIVPGGRAEQGSDHGP